MCYRLRFFLRCLMLGLLSVLLIPMAQAKFHLKQEVNARATVQFLGSSSGKYALVADNGSIFEPTNLKRIYQADGTRVKFTAKFLVSPAPLIAGARVVKITSIHSLPASEFRLPPAVRPGIPKLP
jgi:hypothetical protein